MQICISIFRRTVFRRNQRGCFFFKKEKTERNETFKFKNKIRHKEQCLGKYTLFFISNFCFNSASMLLYFFMNSSSVAYVSNAFQYICVHILAQLYLCSIYVIHFFIFSLIFIIINHIISLTQTHLFITLLCLIVVVGGISREGVGIFQIFHKLRGS